MNYSKLEDVYQFIEYYEDLHQIHEKVINVDMSQELPEQQLIFKYVRKDAKVLELGGNVGRSSIVISKLLKNPKNHVVLESDPDIAKQLIKNKIANHCGFHVVNAALSETPMIQNGWNAKNVEDKRTPLPNGWKYIPTIKYSELIKKFPIKFDTLVVDCEGCMDKILRSYPSILSNIHTIIIENDAQFINHNMNNAIRSFIKKHGFRSVECKKLSGSNLSCFFEVWLR